MTRRYAVHILAHDKPWLFADLVGSLTHELIDIHAHIDRSVAQDPFERCLPAGSTVRFVPARRRVNVRWGGFSQIRATFASLDIAHAGRGRHHRHSLLSGTDVLLRPLPHLLQQWSTDRQFIRIDRRIDTAGQSLSDKVSRWHFPDQPTLARLRLSGRIPRRIDTTVPLYHGSQWWSLTDGAVAAVRATIDAHPIWLARQRFSLCPDEFVVHSALMAGAYRTSVVQDYSSGTSEPDRIIHGQHFIDWSDPKAVRPPELTEHALGAALAGPAMFARKAGPTWTWREGRAC